MQMSFEAMRAMRWLGDNPQAEKLPEDVVGSNDARGVFDELVDKGLIDDVLSLGGHFEFLLTRPGSSVARQIQRIY